MQSPVAGAPGPPGRAARSSAAAGCSRDRGPATTPSQSTGARAATASPSRRGEHRDDDDYNIINIIISCRSCTRVCPPTHGQWTAWAGWSSCTTDCLQFRRRSCSQPTPANGGRYCQGKDLASRNCSAAAASSCAVAGSSLPVLVHYQDTGAGEGGAAGGQLATSDLTLYIGLAVAFLVLVLVVFIIVRLLQRKRSPHTGYSLTSTGTQDTRSLQSFLKFSYPQPTL